MAQHRKFDTETRPERLAGKRDRRSSTRYLVGGSPARLAWHENGEYHTVTLWLRDLSLGGASGLVNERPPRGTLVWVALREDAPDDWIEATLLQVSNTRFFSAGPYRINLKFTTACPYDAFKATVDLARAAEQAPDAVSGPRR